jgi:tRNA threonylcarbamoyladenosine biosynthesis protein TsaB
MILTLRTDSPEAEIGLFEIDKELAYVTWHAHRKLAETIHSKLQQLLASQRKSLADLKGIVVYEGPGSFTGLRIGISVANAFAYGLHIPVVATTGKDWKEQGFKQLANQNGPQSVLPKYGAPVHVTKPKK